MRKNGFFALMGRMKYINRWGLMRNTVSENIAEHSLDVAQLAHALGVIAVTKFGADVDPNLCAAAALYHDAPEILTGDLPTPVKYFNPAIRDAYKSVEKTAGDKILDMLPDEMRGEYEKLFYIENYDGRTHAIVKAADKLSAYIKCIEERKAGNAEFNNAIAENRRSLEENPLPELKYFMDNFIPAYELTLDELE